MAEDQDGGGGASPRRKSGIPENMRAVGDIPVSVHTVLGTATIQVNKMMRLAGFSRQVQHLMFSRKASAGVLYPRHFLGVELTAHVISWISRAV